MAKDIVDVAAGEIGYRESGKNGTKYGAWMGQNGAAWCHMFVSWCAAQAGQGAAVPRTASTSYGMEWFKARGQFKYKGQYTPQRGDIVYFKTGRSHVGIVDHAANGTLFTIEGNSSDMVKRRSYPLSNGTITGYGVPKYSYINNSSGGGGTPTPSGNTTQKKKSSKNELKALKRILNQKDTKPKPIKGEIIETGKIPKCDVRVRVKRGKKLYEIPVKDGMKIVWERKGTPGKLTFTAKFEGKYKVVEGDPVTVLVDGTKIFYGFIFTRKMQKDRMMEYTCYDQLRYLKNKETLVYKNKTATEVIRIIAKRFKLNTGKLVNTGYKYSAIENNSTLFDMIQNILDETLMAKGVAYVLWDDVGKIRLSKVGNMKVNNCLIDEETGENYTYTTTIDNDVYNQIKLIYENKEKGTFDLYVTKNSKKINKWGVLQYVDKIEDPKVGKLKSKALLILYGKRKRTLTITGVIGNKKVHAGSLVPVILNLGDIKVSNYMLVEKVTHEFSNRQHKMELVVSGGDFSG